MIATKNQVFIKLAWPPSVNHYWQSHGKIRYIGKSGLAFRAHVKSIVGVTEPLEGDLSVTIEVMMPDKRKRDLDNLLKAPLDALAHAGVYLDDSQIQDLRIVKMGVVKPGSLNIHIKKLQCST